MPPEMRGLHWTVTGASSKCSPNVVMELDMSKFEACLEKKKRGAGVKSRQRAGFETAFRIDR